MFGSDRKAQLSREWTVIQKSEISLKTRVVGAMSGYIARFKADDLISAKVQYSSSCTRLAHNDRAARQNALTAVYRPICRVASGRLKVTSNNNDNNDSRAIRTTRVRHKQCNMETSRKKHTSK